MAITTSLVVQFTDPVAAEEANAVLIAEIDSRNDGLNSGNTTFTLGSDVGFLIYNSPNVEFSIETTAGSITSFQDVTIPKSEFLTYANSNSATLDKPPEGTVTITQVGGTIRSWSNDQSTVTPDTDENVLAVIKAEYDTVAHERKLVNVTYQEPTPVVILVTGTIIET